MLSEKQSITLKVKEDKQMSNREKVVNYLKKYIGIKEGSEKHKEIINTFNNSGLCSRYKMTTKDAWCATAVSAAFIDSKLTDIFPCVECSCANMTDKAKKAGIWVENDAFVPNTGDVIMYDWDDNGVGDNTGRPDHVGIVVSVSGNDIKVIEGNVKDTVGYRTLKVNGKYIRGYITPKYSNSENKTEKVESKVEVKEPVKKTFAGEVTATLLNVRKQAGPDKPVCSTFGPLKKGTKLTVLDTVKDSKGSDWYFVEVNGKRGYSNAAYIKKV